MESKYLAINSALLFWLLGLLAWCFESTYMALLSGSFSLSSFVFHFQYHRVNHMFKKNKTIDVTPQPASVPAPVNDKVTSAARKPDTTVIASGMRFEGNIIAAGNVDIYGTVSGDIDAKENQIKIMTGGLLEGNITCRELVIDGCVIGQCSSDTIEIDKTVTSPERWPTVRWPLKRAACFPARQKCCRRSRKRTTWWDSSRIPR